MTTLFELYEWLAMPMGLQNSPPIHQRRMTAALREYLDDIMIWSNTVEQHTEHIRLVLSTLCRAKLYCNPKKMSFLLTRNGIFGSSYLGARY